MAIILGAFCRFSSALAARSLSTSALVSSAFSRDFQLPPKRPPNAYILFVKDRLLESRDSELDRSHRDLMRDIGSMWSSLETKEKERYREMSEAQVREWQTVYQSFLDTLPDRDDYFKQLKEFRRERRKYLKGYREKRQRKLTRPPRKLAGYNIYVRDQVAGATKEDHKTRFADAAHSWKLLSEEEKTEYEQEAKQIYEHEMEEYNNSRP